MKEVGTIGVHSNIYTCVCVYVYCMYKWYSYKNSTTISKRSRCIWAIADWFLSLCKRVPLVWEARNIVIDIDMKYDLTIDLIKPKELGYKWCIVLHLRMLVVCYMQHSADTVRYKQQYSQPGASGKKGSLLHWILFQIFVWLLWILFQKNVTIFWQ